MKKINIELIDIVDLRIHLTEQKDFLARLKKESVNQYVRLELNISFLEKTLKRIEKTNIGEKDA